VFELCFSDEFLQKWVAHVMQSCSRQMVMQPVFRSFSYSNYIGVVIELLARPRFRAAWLNSPHFCSDLERLYSLPLLTTQEWRDYLKVTYHPLLTKAYSNKIKYEKSFKEMYKQFKKRQGLLMQVTAMLLDQ